MQQITHIHSRTTGTLIGAHHGLKAKLVRLSTGEKQYWKNDSIYNQEDEVTSKILFRLSGPKNNTWDIIERYFDTVEEASEYLHEMKGLNHLTDFSKNGETARVSNGWTISSNYDIRDIMKVKPPERDLSDAYPFDLRKTLTLKHKAPTMTGDAVKVKSTKVYPSGTLVRLQDLTKEPRKARVILRGLVRKNAIAKPARWEWPEGSKDLDVVRKALSNT